MDQAQTVLDLGALAVGDIVELAKGKKNPPPPLILRHSLFLLPLFVAASVLVLALSYIVPKTYRFIKKHLAKPSYEPLLADEDDAEGETVPPTPTTMPSGGLWSDFSAHIRTMKEYGSFLFATEIFRTLCLCALLGLSIYAAIQAESPITSTSTNEYGVDDVEDLTSKWGKKKKKKKAKHHKSTVDDYSSLEWSEFGVCGFYTYAAILSFMLLTLRPATPLRRHLIAHLDTLLLLGFGVYAYRDLWPLFTFHLDPADVQNAITWSRAALLTLVAVVIPLIRPRTYTPANPENPTPEKDIHPEQTASFLSYIFFDFMTGLVWKAWKTPALPYDDLHPLADYDRAEHLYKLHMDGLDPVRRRNNGLKSRHLLLSIASVFKKEIVIVSIMCLLSGASNVGPSLAINKLLSYIESGGTGTNIRPIVWIIVLFVAPTLGSLTIQYYIFTTTRSLVRAEALLTQLLFDHALRLRMKDSVEQDDKEKLPAADPPTIRVEEVDHALAAPDEMVSDSNESTEVGSNNGSSKGKAVDPKSVEGVESNKPSGQGLAGKINVLMAADVESIINGRDLALCFVYAPVEFALSTFLLYRILSWSALIGMLTILITLPIPGMLTKKNAYYQQKRMEATDSRVDVITESIGALRIIKMFGWEDRIKERVAAKREDELTLIWKRRLMNLATGLINNILPVFTMTVTFAIYTIVQKQQLTAAKVFTSMTIFELLKGSMHMIFYLANEFVTGWVSVQRINKFLHESEMIDEFAEGTVLTIKPREQLEAETDGLIRLHDATFTWGTTTSETEAEFKLNIPDVTFVKGKTNLITGPTGAGKSSFLKALIGELHFEQKQGAFFHLPREGGVSYAAQESWCMSDSIRVNILFGEPYEEERYSQVLKVCGLEPDIKLWDNGDETEVGEKGITLSGGQKARITLARAIYSKAKVVLLDDIFSALDTLTSRWIIDNLFKGDLVEDRTILLITHHVHLAAPIAAYMIALDGSGNVRSQGPIEDGHIEGEDLQEAAEEVEDEEPKAQSTIEEQIDKVEEKKPIAKLVKDEEKSEGRISRRALISFFSTFGGAIFWVSFFALMVSSQAAQAFQTYWLGRWARAYDLAADPNSVSVVYYLGLYLVFVLAGLVVLSAAAILFYIGAFKASREVHKKLVTAVFGAYMRFLDSTPVGRIIGRFTKDMKSVDGPFPDTFYDVVDISVGMALKFLVVVFLVPLFSIPAIIIGVIGGFLGELYIHGQLSVKREMSNAKTPLFSYFSAAVNGIVSIRAFGAQQKLREEAQRRADKYTRTATAVSPFENFVKSYIAMTNFTYNLNRWVTVRVDMLGALFGACLAAFLIYGGQYDASTAGFALSQAIAFSQMILWWVRTINMMEVEGNAVERIEDYLIIDQEPTEVESKRPPASWPTSGEIILDKLSAKYSQDGPTVLDQLSLRIASGEKVGIVGRTGSGKSTTALALLRMIPTTGSVVIDGIDTRNVNLHSLRSNVTIIPQDPILLSGSLRFNLDPFDEHDDVELNDALQSSGLGQTRHAETGAATPQRLTLDTQIAAGGGNLSQGQRQLVALARALVRASKVLILDEATASVDFETDTLIQKSIRSLPSSTTVLTVAHRLSTVMDYDKILVLDKGQIVEFDSPDNLKNNEGSYFAKLVQAMEG